MASWLRPDCGIAALRGVKVKTQGPHGKIRSI
jgi:hypothetical protein